MNKNHRVDLLDLTKGFAIFLVVFGHVIQFGSGKDFLSNREFFLDPVFSFIYSFHMPIFMLLSGFLFYRAKDKGVLEIFKVKSTSLLLPVLVWQSLFFLLTLMSNDLNFLSLLRKYISSVVHGLWFLWAVFYCSMLVSVVNKILKDSHFRKIAYVIVLVLTLFTPDFINLHLYKYMLPYFIIGYYSQCALKKLDSLNKKSHIIYIAIFCSSFFVLLKSYDYNSYIYTSKYFILSSEIPPFQHFKIDVFRFLIGILGSISIILIINAINKSNWFSQSYFKEGVLYLGRNSLGIYIISGYIMLALVEIKFYNSLDYMLSFFTTIFVIAVCLLVIKLIKINKISSLLLLGLRKKQSK